MTGDPSWVRGPIRPRVATSTDVQGGLTDEEIADVRRRALPVIAAYRDAGCVPHSLPPDLLQEMMDFLACKPVEGSKLAMFFEDMQFDGTDPRAVQWGPEVPDERKAATHVVVVGCGESGILAPIQPSAARGRIEIRGGRKRREGQRKTNGQRSEPTNPRRCWCVEKRPRRGVPETSETTSKLS